jgi:hypothetical protein
MSESCRNVWDIQVTLEIIVLSSVTWVADVEDFIIDLYTIPYFSLIVSENVNISLLTLWGPNYSFEFQ